jgi:hypothetical protein
MAEFQVFLYNQIIVELISSIFSKLKVQAALNLSLIYALCYDKFRKSCIISLVVSILEYQDTGHYLFSGFYRELESWVIPKLRIPLSYSIEIN